MFLVMIKNKHVYHYCGFLTAPLWKSFFYVFLASLAFSNYTLWECWLVGVIFAVVAGSNLITYFGKEKGDTDD